MICRALTLCNIREIYPMSRNILLAGLFSTLGACGIVEPGTPNTAEKDTTAPVIQSVSPDSLRNRQIDPNATELRFYFSEGLSQESIDIIKNSSANNSSAIAFTPALDFTATYTAADETNPYNYVTITLAEALTPDSNYSVSLKSAIKDKAGLSLALKTYDFSTPPAFYIGGSVSSLEGPLRININIPAQNISDYFDIIGDGVGSTKTFTFSQKITNGNEFQASIDHMDTTVGFCSLDKTSGKVNNGDIILTVSCDRVEPVNSQWSYWTENALTESGELIHFGALRKLVLPATYTSCDGLTVTDQLGVFDWRCDAAGGVVTVSSTNIKTGKGLRDLIDFTLINWKKNRIKINGSNVSNSNEARWWNNPVLKLVSGTYNNLNRQYGVYISSTGDAGNLSINFASNNISLVTQNTLSGKITGEGSMIVVQGIQHWIEGSFLAKMENIIKFQSAGYVRLHNTIIDGQNKNNQVGILVDDGSFGSKSTHILMDNVTVYDNAADGIRILGNNPDAHIVLNDIVSVNNGMNGLTVNAINITLNNIYTAGNTGNGLELTGADNRVHMASSFGNSGNGIHANGLNSSFIAQVVSSANTGYGLLMEDKNETVRLRQTRNNFLNSLTLTDNGISAISDTSTGTDTTGADIVNGNHIDAFNADSITDHGSLSSLFLGGFGDPNSSPTILYRGGAVNSFSSWNKDIAPAFNAGNGACVDGSADSAACQMIDWSLVTGSAFAGANAAAPDGTIAEHWVLFSPLTATEIENLPAETMEVTDSTGTNNGICEIDDLCQKPLNYLAGAIEISGDNIGNDNILCEDGETCLYTPHNGSYQGHGTMSEVPGSWTASKGITVLEYMTPAH